MPNLTLRSLFLLPLISLASCAAMVEEHRAQVCNREYAYEQGVNDSQDGKPMDSGFASLCDSNKREVMQGYREGYEFAANQSVIEASDDGIRIKGAGIDIRMGNKGAKDWSCELNIFGQTFRGLGSSRAEAAQDVRNACEQKHNAVHCGHADCKRER